MGMSLLERKTFSQAVEEVKDKAVPTYKVSQIRFTSEFCITTPSSSPGWPLRLALHSDPEFLAGARAQSRRIR